MCTSKGNILTKKSNNKKEFKKLNWNDYIHVYIKY